MTVYSENLAAPLKEGGCPVESLTLPHAGTTPTIIDRVEVLSLSGGKFVNRLMGQNDKLIITNLFWIVVRGVRYEETPTFCGFQGGS